MREMIVSMLAEMAVEVRTVDVVAHVAIECRRGEFDLVIMLDIAPFFNGSKPIATLRPRLMRRPELLVFSWQHSERVVLSLLECGVSQYVTFPINIRRIRGKICDLLESKR